MVASVEDHWRTKNPRVCYQSYGKVAMAVCRKAAVVFKSPAKARDPLMQGRRTACPRTETYVQSLHVQEIPQSDTTGTIP
jgi:hypothetical protein